MEGRQEHGSGSPMGHLLRSLLWVPTGCGCRSAHQSLVTYLYPDRGLSIHDPYLCGSPMGTCIYLNLHYGSIHGT